MGIRRLLDISFTRPGLAGEVETAAPNLAGASLALFDVALFL
jgi:hypothetical protein